MKMGIGVLMVKVPGVTPNNKQCLGIVKLIDMYPTFGNNSKTISSS
jgi:hypothetical protein